MRIHTRPYITTINGNVTSHVVSMVGVTPNKIFFIEEDIGFVGQERDAPLLIGEFLRRNAEQHDHAVPSIPGVTAPGVWVNPRFGDPEAWRAKHSLKARDARKAAQQADKEAPCLIIDHATPGVTPALTPATTPSDMAAVVPLWPSGTAPSTLKT